MFPLIIELLGLLLLIMQWAHDLPGATAAGIALLIVGFIAGIPALKKNGGK